jgi:hypothetical protein
MYKITAGGDNFIFTMPAASSSSSGVSSIKITTTTPLSGGSSNAKTGNATYSLSIDTSGTWSGGANYLNMQETAPAPVVN